LYTTVIVTHFVDFAHPCAFVPVLGVWVLNSKDKSVRKHRN